ncbi:hypothetical protein C7N43_37635 [Sphingobacteriales bacterium UPWRP_1]|nr:hypothetical protein C7N43_37635 [Sphingobacteriales bacterium UPWRP_1]
MITQQNNYQQQIANYFDSADYSIKVAVSWFTDEVLIQRLIDKVKSGIKVDVLLSCDNLNLLRHKLFRKLINSGGQVRKLGSESALDGGFMHTKEVIIDNQVAYGGSYNFTKNAKSHYEQFKKWDASELRGIIADFNSWFSKGDDLFLNVPNPDAIVCQLQQQFMEEQNDGFVTSESIFMDFSEEKYIRKKEQEVKVSHIQKMATSLSTNKASINEKGQTVHNTTGVISKPHKFYGGSATLIKSPNATRKTFSLSTYQKHTIVSRYSFLKCRIENGTLICTGELQPEYCDRYKIRIEFREGYAPLVFITSPHIEPRSAIHMYKEGCLCLFYPGEFKWRNTTKIAEYTIPWIVEWVLYYEIWKITGKWEGAEHLH